MQPVPTVPQTALPSFDLAMPLAGQTQLLQSMSTAASIHDTAVLMLVAGIMLEIGARSWNIEDTTWSRRNLHFNRPMMALAALALAGSIFATLPLGFAIMVGSAGLAFTAGQALGFGIARSLYLVCATLGELIDMLTARWGYRGKS